MCVQCIPVVWDWSNLKMASWLYVQLIFNFSPCVEMYVFWRLMGCDVLPVSLVKAANVALCQVKEMSERKQHCQLVSPSLKWPLRPYCPNWINQGVMGSALAKGEFDNPNNLGIRYFTLIAWTSFQFSLSSLKGFDSQCKLGIKERHWMYKSP